MYEAHRTKLKEKGKKKKKKKKRKNPPKGEVSVVPSAGPEEPAGAPIGPSDREAAGMPPPYSCTSDPRQEEAARPRC